ncbi:spore germination cell wall hydrolase CwlJ-like protein [Sphingomonas naasensis]|uniref:Cell wall hydrolase n=1 Tax=Sphingomonas naasensis TaxID=1344951 RepID=A0A4S1WI66_9SPHN|nr:cell wall hydrolase [Sphingomonas naasensis]NIJ21594.1 spore germination cell wall hydrolase CwlJ-like protein [Sphingomonas naasensis]TGX41467.1 cell wall hydrolase [Sphingomonas naasensis]
MQARGLTAAAIVSLIGAGFSAKALSPAAPPELPRTPPSGFEAEDHFPGAAWYTAVSDEAAVATGTTGTMALPDLPVPEGAVVDSSIQPAAPFHVAGSAIDHARALQCLTQAVYYEAASEPDDGQRAVAQVVLNRVRHPAFPATVCGVVFQGSEKRGCQFSFACDGAMARIPSRVAWARAARVAEAALAGSVFAPVGMATHYHTYAVTPSWNRALVMTGVFGAHFFHRWKGWWGMAAAFHQAYRGGEPLPAPHLAAATAMAALPADRPHPARPPVVAPAAIQPAYVESGTPTADYAASTLPESQILDKWKDSGKPLR